MLMSFENKVFLSLCDRKFFPCMHMADSSATTDFHMILLHTVIDLQIPRGWVSYEILPPVTQTHLSLAKASGLACTPEIFFKISNNWTLWLTLHVWAHASVLSDFYDRPTCIAWDQKTSLCSQIVQLCDLNIDSNRNRRAWGYNLFKQGATWLEGNCPLIPKQGGRLTIRKYFGIILILIQWPLGHRLRQLRLC